MARHKNKIQVYSEAVIEAITLLRIGRDDDARTIFADELIRAKNDIPSRRWAYRYHYALAQAGAALLASGDEQQYLAAQALELYQQAVENCGWAGVLDDAIFILRALRKADTNNLLQPIEHDLVEKREIAWNNRPFKD